MNTQTDVPKQSTTSPSRSRRGILSVGAVVAAAVIVVALAPGNAWHQAHWPGRISRISRILGAGLRGFATVSVLEAEAHAAAAVPPAQCIAGNS